MENIGDSSGAQHMQPTEQHSQHHPAPVETDGVPGGGPDAPASYPLRPHNDIRALYFTRPAFFARLEELLDSCGPEEDVFAAISFVDWDFKLPRSGRRWWEALNECAARGANVCALLWSPLRPKRWGGVVPATQQTLKAAKKHWRFAAAWDVSPWNNHCHHQKYFYTSRHGCFVGGMVLSGSSRVVEPHGAGHDTFLELGQGSGAQWDVRRNFVDRWNDVLGRYRKNTAAAADAVGGGGGGGGASGGSGRNPVNSLCVPLPLCVELPDQGEVDTAHPDAGNVVPAAVAARAMARREGVLEFAAAPSAPVQVWLAYEKAFKRARYSIYIESQHPGETHLLRLVEAALARGVTVAYVLPIRPMRAVSAARHAYDVYNATHGSAAASSSTVGSDSSSPSHVPASAAQPFPAYYDLWAQLGRLEVYDNFQLMGLLQAGDSKYVHSKLCVVDGTWGTLGSANMVDISFLEDHTELNVAWHSPYHALRVLRALAHHHHPYTCAGAGTGTPTRTGTGAAAATEGGGHREDVALVRCLIHEARRNRAATEVPRQHATVVALDASTYPRWNDQRCKWSC